MYPLPKKAGKTHVMCVCLFVRLLLHCFCGSRNNKKMMTAGTDPKSVALNIASILLFLLSFVAYFYYEYIRQAAIAVVVSFLIAYVTPPMGWRRPHPYSDDPNNRPYPRKGD